mmetsp:Transcript_96407/g.221085  ORF Transcript_96407/g.221085 Transcript_96407/m.221085 type:complete len:304 (-) Transcript_96407:136-1047(-)
MFWAPEFFFSRPVCVLEFLVVVVSVTFDILVQSGSMSGSVLKPSVLRAVRPAIRGVKTIITAQAHIRRGIDFRPRDLNRYACCISVHGARGLPPEMVQGLKVKCSLVSRRSSSVMFERVSKSAHASSPADHDYAEDVDKHLQTVIAKLVLFKGMSHSEVAQLTELSEDTVKAVLRAHQHCQARWDQCVLAMVPHAHVDLKIELRDSRGKMGSIVMNLFTILDQPNCAERAAWEVGLLPDRRDDLAMMMQVDRSLVQVFLYMTVKLRALVPEIDWSEKLVHNPFLAPLEEVTETSKHGVNHAPD